MPASGFDRIVSAGQPRGRVRVPIPQLVA